MTSANLFSTSLRTGLLAGLLASLLVLVTACAAVPEPRLFPHAPNQITAQTEALLPADIILLGEQHDAPEHQQIEQQVIEYLAVRGQLGAVALEMAEAGNTTAALKSNSTQRQVRAALNWNEKSWPWQSYGPAVMAAVKAGVPVLGANLPAARMKDTMANSQLDQQLPGPALKAQQQLIRMGHCGLLPENRISPMTRIQIARDISMARILDQAALPGKPVVLLTGSGHANRMLGVAQHLPPEMKIKAVLLRAEAAPAESDTRRDADDQDAFDAVWLTPPLPERDYCADMRPPSGAPS
jgi:uncharacterized iron-regulated protein